MTNTKATEGVAVLAAMVLALLVAGVMSYEIFINHAFTRAYVESIVVGIIGAVLLVIAVFALPERMALAFRCHYSGLSAAVCSAVGLFLSAQPWLRSGIGQQWEALVPFSLALAATVSFRIIEARANRQKQRSPLRSP